MLDFNHLKTIIFGEPSVSCSTRRRFAGERKHFAAVFGHHSLEQKIRCIMRSNSVLAIWLALIMLLLVSAAAVFFLVQRNAQLETELQQASQGAETAQAAAAATRDRLLSDVTVRQAALDTASTTRDTLAAEAELNTGLVQKLESSLSQQEDSLVEAQATLQALALQVFIIAPVDGATVPPLKELDVMATARSDVRLTLVTLTVDDRQIAQLPAEGQNTMNVRASWTPPAEATYVIRVEAFAVDGRSESAEVTIDAAFASDVAREAALRDQMEEAALALRFPASQTAEETTPSADAAAAGAEDGALHRLLLTGQAVDDEEANADEAYVLQALELIISEAGYQAYLDAVVEADLQAFYDPVAGTLMVYQPGDEGGVFGRWQSIHDFSHQQQAERLGLEALDVPAMDRDQRLAVRALVEGDSVFLQHRMLVDEALSAEQADEVRAGLAAAASDATAALPIALQDMFEFAYSQGVPFVQTLYDQGGFALVDGAWRQLPVSSEQILHPERYLDLDMPVPVTLAPLDDSLGQGWRLVEEDTFGEFLLRQHLGRQPLTVGQIDLASNGWGGGRYAVYQGQDVDIPLVIIRLAWDSPEDANQFSEVYSDYLARRFGDDESSLEGGRCWQADGVGCLFQVGTDSLVVRAPTLELAQVAAEPQLNMSQG